MKAWKVLNILCSLGLIGFITSVKSMDEEELKKCLKMCTMSQMAALKAGKMLCGKLEDKNGPIVACHLRCYGDNFKLAKDQRTCHCEYCKSHPTGHESYCVGVGTGGTKKADCDIEVCKGKAKYHGPFCAKKKPK